MDMESFFSASCVGGIIGMTLMTRSTRCVIWNKDPDNMAFENFPWTGGVAQIVISWVLSPVASGVCAAALYAVVRYGIFAWENCYLRARIAFPLVVFFTVTVNVTYFIVKGAKGQAERFGTVGMVREAKEEGNLAPAPPTSRPRPSTPRPGPRPSTPRRRSSTGPR